MSASSILVCAVPGRGGGLELSEQQRRRLQPFDIHTPQFRAVGYLQCSAGKAAPEYVVRAVLDGPSAEPNAYCNEYFLVVWETSTGMVRVATDDTGAFPVYVGWDGKVWWITTSLKEVASRLPRLKLNIHSVVRWLTGEREGGISTILQDVLSVPAGTTLLLNPAGVWHLVPSRVSEPSVITANYLPDAADAIVAALEFAIRDRAVCNPSANVASDLTSGLDSSLVAWAANRCGKELSAFSMVEGPDDPDCRVSVIRAFAARHMLSHQIINVTNKEPFATDEDIRWGSQSPETVAWSQLAQYLDTIAAHGHELRLTGEGGDEVLTRNYPPTAESNQLVAFAQRHQERMRQGLDTVLSPTGAKLAGDVGPELDGLPSRIPQTVIQSRRALFPLAWNSGVWPLAPFLDHRVLRAARTIPPALTSKHELWRHRSDIFLPAQLEPKLGQVGSTVAFAVRRFDFLCDLLKMSVLERAGIIEPKRILARLTENTAAVWLTSIVGTWLWRLVALEVFLQGLGEINVEETR